MNRVLIFVASCLIGFSFGCSGTVSPPSQKVDAPSADNDDPAYEQDLAALVVYIKELRDLGDADAHRAPDGSSWRRDPTDLEVVKLGEPNKLRDGTSWRSVAIRCKFIEYSPEDEIRQKRVARDLIYAYYRADGTVREITLASAGPGPVAVDSRPAPKIAQDDKAAADLAALMALVKVRAKDPADLAILELGEPNKGDPAKGRGGTYWRNVVICCRLLDHSANQVVVPGGLAPGEFWIGGAKPVSRTSGRVTYLEDGTVEAVMLADVEPWCREIPIPYHIILKK